MRNIRQWLVKEFLSPKVNSEKLTERLRSAFPPDEAPVIWLLGKAQSGKTSIVRTMTGATDAEIGQGFQPCTRTSRLYRFPDPENCFLQLLDTRGIGEVDYDPADDIESLNSRSHMLLVTMKVGDHAQSAIHGLLRRIVARHPHWPLIVAQTCLHELYEPGSEHTLPYPFASDREPDNSTDDHAASNSKLARAIDRQQHDLLEALGEKWSQNRVEFVPIDFTLPEDGFEPVDYGRDFLLQKFAEHCPDIYRILVLENPQSKKILTDVHFRKSRGHIIFYSLASAGAGAIPIPVIDIPMLLAIQGKMFQAISSIYGQQLTARLLSELLAALGTGFLLRYLGRLALRESLKVVPVAGSIVSGAYAAACTYSLGVSFCYYMDQVKQGITPERKVMQELFAAQFQTAQSLFTQTGEETTEESQKHATALSPHKGNHS